MATAPPSFGVSSLPIPAMLPQPGPTPGEVLAPAINDAASAVAGAAQETRATDKRIALIQYDRAQQAQYADRAAALATMQGDLQTQVAQLQRTAPDGAAGHEQAVSDLVNNATNDFMGTITDPKVRNELLPDVAHLKATFNVQAAAFAASARADKTVKDFGVLLNQTANNVFTSPTSDNLNGALQLLGGAIDRMDLSADKKDDLRREAQKAVTIRGWQGGMVQNPQAALDALDKGVLNGVATNEEIYQLRRSAQARVDHLEAQERSRTAQQVEAFVQTARADISDVDHGVIKDPAALAAQAQMAETFGKIDLAHDLRDAAARAAVTSKFTASSPAEIDAARRAIESKPDWQTDPQLVAAHTQLNNLFGHVTDQAKNDQLGVWSANGGQITPFNIADPASIRQRVTEAQAAAARYGGPLQMLTAAEAAPMQQSFAKGGPGDRAQLIQTISAYGPEVGKALMRQLAPQKPEYATLVDLAAMRNRAAGAGLMNEALNGWEELKANKTLLGNAQTQAMMQQDVDGRFGPALRSLDPVAKQGVMDVARGIYATRAVRQGVQGYNEGLWRDSVNAALGAAGDGTGGLGKARSGEPMVLPRGETQGDVDLSIARANEAHIEASAFGGRDVPTWSNRPMQLSEFKSLTPVLVKDDGVQALYQFRSKSGFARSKAHPGENFTLDLRALGRLSGQP